MTTITKERLLTIKQWRETYGPGSNVVLPAEEAEELARIALASLEAEPIGEVSEKRLGLVMDGTVDLGGKSTYRIIKGEKTMKLLPLGTKFYTAPPAPIALEAIENAIEYIRSIAFHIDEDDYHGKHIAYFMRQALAWLEGHSCSDDRLGKADNQPVRGNQAAESNRGNEWTGNPDIDNAIIMLDRIDTAESYDDDRIEAVKAVLRRLAGNSPVTPDGWISCSERMPDSKTAVLVAREFDRKGDWRMKWATYIPGHPDANDGWIIPGASWKPSHWMPLPEPPQEAK
ncbi:DUF551 domain-containing protein [Escherichia coli]|nr:DUF551 domain-containing protein [Escherichia coli]